MMGSALCGDVIEECQWLQQQESLSTFQYFHLMLKIVLLKCVYRPRSFRSVVLTVVSVMYISLLATPLNSRSSLFLKL